MVRSELDLEDSHDGRIKDRRGDRDRDDDGDRDRDRTRDREKPRDRERERMRDKEKLKDKERDKEKARDREKEREKDRARERDRDKERDRDRDRERDREKEIDRERGKDREDKDRERSRDRDERDERDRDRDRNREKDRDERDDRDRDRERNREKDRDRFRENSRDLEREQDGDRDRVKDSDDKLRELSKHKEKDDKKRDRGKDRNGIDKGREADGRRESDLGKERKKDKDKREKDGEKTKEKDREREKDEHKDKQKEREKTREREREREGERERDRSREITSTENDVEKERDNDKQHELNIVIQRSTKDVREVDMKAQHEIKAGNRDSGSEIAAWVSKSRNLAEQKKIEERIKAARMARLLSEQDSGEESEDEAGSTYSKKDLAGLKVLHGFDKVLDGGAVVLTLKDKGILAGDDVNDEFDELENLEISQQLGRDKAYEAAKKKSGVYEDKFQNDINAVRTILPQYDEEMEDGLTLDETGGLNEEGRKRLEELKKKLQGGEKRSHESLLGSARVASDVFTQEEMLQFNKPKKKKKLRKKEKLDLDLLEADTKAELLDDVDHRSRSSNATLSRKLEKEQAAEESRKAAYMNAYNKALDASQKLKQEQTLDRESDDTPVFGGEDDDELERSLHRARQAALKKQWDNGAATGGPQAVAAAVVSEASLGSADDFVDKDKTTVVFTETEEFCRNIQLDEAILRRPGKKDVFEDDEPIGDERSMGLDGGWMEVNEDKEDEKLDVQQSEEDVSMEEAVSEVTVGKGLAGALQLLKERGTLKETVDWGGRNMDKKKSKLIGIMDQEEKFKNREIILDRIDEFGRVMTPKESFRKLSHKFHGKGPGKMKQEKRMKQYEEEMKLKQMSSADTPLLSMEKMRDHQAKLHTPYVVISGHIKPGQTSDPRSGFGTMEKEAIGSLTPMLGDQKVEYFLGIKRKPEGGSMRPPLPKKVKPDK